jgi:superfamily II DNA or RNA helicase
MEQEIQKIIDNGDSFLYIDGKGDYIKEKKLTSSNKEFPSCKLINIQDDLKKYYFQETNDFHREEEMKHNIKYMSEIVNKIIPSKKTMKFDEKIFEDIISKKNKQKNILKKIQNKSNLR